MYSDEWPAINAENPVVYRVRGSVAGLGASTPFEEPSKLVRHLKRTHNLTLPDKKPGLLNAREQRLHDNGLEWLARCAFFGRDKVDDEAPVPNRH
ncbi:hypothetical protein Aspvir_002016 [Aspergillus viridinutans]|uniref:Uncharacterized protein n=1 Tax=Aspergillus viridinutans TaxID=75553 RepID=A0A9P3C1H5_ASPVI|nr:uncharacterized protein Aspvir_002016 [Aspergillus viridinutans]GIK06368.1 hypothetical protein Aspvir_002016 [Aspergillus viridinutans]